MKLWAIAVCAVTPILAAATATRAEPLTLICKGTLERPNRDAADVTFQVILDPEAGTASLDGKPVKRVTFTPEEVRMFFPANVAGRAVMGVFTMGLSELGRKGTALEDRVLSIDRRSGIFRDTDGSGACEKRDLTQRMF